MKTVLRVMGVLLALVGGQVFAQQELTGTWQGKVDVDKTTSMTIRFTFVKQPTGKYTAVLNSPDNTAVKDVPASGVTWNAGTLKVDVASLNGAYNGTYKDGRFEGQWTQQGTALPLVLSPYQKPQLSKTAIDTLSGIWRGPLNFPGGKLTFVYRFSPDDQGGLKGTLAVPEQGGAELPMSEIEFANDKLSFKVPVVQGEYTATLANGVLTGAWKQPAPGAPPDGMPVSLKKGAFVPQTYPLKLSTEAFAALNGTWKGKLEPLNLAMRFAMTPDGRRIVGFIDSPDQKAMNIPITDATFASGKLTVKVAAVQAEYVGTVSGKTITGTWKQGKETPLTWTRQ